MRSRYFAGIIGNILEHYDQALFGFLAPFLAPKIFPDSDPIEALLYTYALMPLGLISRPIGALFFGWLGDRIGRKNTLSITLVGMALVTGMMGFFPPAAPLLWGLSRLLQNFFAAGENTGGALYLLEGSKNQSIWSSLYDASGILGILAASGAVAMASFLGIPWKYLFWVGFATGIFGIWVRRTKMEEGPRAILIDPLLPTIWRTKREIGKIATVSGFSYANYYMLTTFLNGFLPLVSSITFEQAIAMNTFLLLADFFLLPFFGFVAARVGKERLMLAAVLLSIGASGPLLGLAEGASLTSALFIRLSMTCLGVACAAPYHAWALETAPVKHRYLVCALGSALGSKILGAPAPALGLMLYKKTNSATVAAFPILITGLFAAISLYRKRLEVIENEVIYRE